MYIAPSFAKTVQEEFFSWVEDFDESQEDVPYDLLQRYIGTWLARDSAVRITGGDYSNYLLAVLIIIHEYTKNPSRLDYRPSRRERRVRALIDLDESSAVHLDRYKYQEEVFYQLMEGHP